MDNLQEKRSLEDLEKIKKLAGKTLALSRDDLLIHLRFLDAALAKLPLQERFAMDCIASDGKTLFYDPLYVLRLYKENPALLTRAYLHSLLHCIFSHSFGYENMETAAWDLAVDISVEAMILELNLPSVMLDTDAGMQGILKVLKEDAGAVTAEKLYRFFRKNPPSPVRMREYRHLFARDAHSLWKQAEQMEITKEEWQQLSRRIRAELKAFSQSKGKAEVLEQNLNEALRETYDYSDILRRFTVMGENITVNEDEFDYIYYTYGMELYGNLPLIEPLEYKEDKRVKEFVIAIDTSSSCRGDLVQAFLKKTYQILKGSENFFKRVNVHIVQCDSEVQSDYKITGEEDFQTFMQYGKIHGYGATDFRPVFDYIETLKDQGEFENLKGLIYFTDGYGIYPERMPDYDVIFAFLNEDENRQPVPPWSLKVILKEEELEQQ